MNAYERRQYASEIAHIRWDGMSKEQRRAAAPKGGRRPRRYPLCPRYRYHRFRRDLCPCGFNRAAPAPVQAPISAPQPPAKPTPPPLLIR